MRLSQVKWTVGAAVLAVGAFAVLPAVGQVGAGNQAAAQAEADQPMIEDAPAGFIPDPPPPAAEPDAPADAEAGDPIEAEDSGQPPAPEGFLPTDPELPPDAGPVIPDAPADGPVASELEGSAPPGGLAPPGGVEQPGGLAGPGAIEAPAAPTPVLWHSFAYIERCYYGGEFRTELLLFSDGTFVMNRPELPCGHTPPTATGWWQVRGRWLTLQFEEGFIDYARIAGEPGQWGLYFDGAYWPAMTAAAGGAALPTE